MLKRMALLLFSFLLLLGCIKSRMSQLSDRTDVFNRSLRWGSMATAAGFIAEENRKTLLEKLARDLGQNRIVDFSVVDLGLDKEDRKGSVLVEFSYYGVSDQNLRYRQELQLWQWDSKKKDWFLLEARDLPVRKN